LSPFESANTQLPPGALRSDVWGAATDTARLVPVLDISRRFCGRDLGTMLICRFIGCDLMRFFDKDSNAYSEYIIQFEATS